MSKTRCTFISFLLVKPRGVPTVLIQTDFRGRTVGILYEECSQMTLKNRKACTTNSHLVLISDIPQSYLYNPTDPVNLSFHHLDFFLNDNCCIWLKNSIEIYSLMMNKSSLVQLMAWRRTGDQWWPISMTHINIIFIVKTTKTTRFDIHE